MVSRQTVTEFRDRYPWGSWAVWDDEFPEGDCVEKKPDEVAEFIVDQSEDLRTDVVMLGLNRAENLPAPFVNFHSPSGKHYDHRLKEFIQDGGLTRLQGAYMTDLVDEVDPDSYNVTVTEDDAQLFEDQLSQLGEGEIHVICFGNKPFQGLIDYYDVAESSIEPEIRYASVDRGEYALHLYRVWFYGLYGANHSKVKTVEKQLRHLNQRIEDG